MFDSVIVPGSNYVGNFYNGGVLGNRNKTTRKFEEEMQSCPE